YKLQKQVEEREAKLLEFQQENEAIEARAKEAEAKAAEERRLREELEDRMRSKKYEEVAKDEWVYIMKESSELHNNKHKIGKTINLPSRKSNLKAHVCQSCLKKSRSGCCAEYSIDNRSRRDVVIGVKLVRG
ncbi:hypothetical protein HK102_012657, partial [Quaeritorhiza haematococci]